MPASASCVPRSPGNSSNSTPCSQPRAPRRTRAAATSKVAAAPTAGNPLPAGLKLYGSLDSGVEYVSKVGANATGITRIPSTSGSGPSTLGLDFHGRTHGGIAAIGKAEMGPLPRYRLLGSGQPALRPPALRRGRLGLGRADLRSPVLDALLGLDERRSAGAKHLWPRFHRCLCAQCARRQRGRLAGELRQTLARPGLQLRARDGQRLGARLGRLRRPRTAPMPGAVGAGRQC